MEIDLRKTWCIANVPNHDKLRMLGFDHEPISCCGDYYYINEHYEIYDSNVFNRDFKQVELNEDNEFVYVENKEDSIDESSSNIIEKELNEDNIFTKYGFEKPDFECEILKEYGSWLIGYVKNGTEAPIPCMWFSYDGSCNINGYKLTPIKKPWYETCKFPCVIMAEGCLPVIVHYYKNGHVYDFRDDRYCVRTWNPATNEEIEGLKQCGN